MNKVIKLSGISAIPDDYQSPDGELSTALNIISEDGALHPLTTPHTIFSLPFGCNALFLHRNSQYYHIIVSDDNNRLYWLDYNKAIDFYDGNGDIIYKTTIIFNPNEEHGYTEGMTVYHDGRYFIFTSDHPAGQPWSGDDVSDITDVTLKPIMTTTHNAQREPDPIYQLRINHIYDITAIGNTVVITAADNMHYIFFAEAADDYNYLSTHLPECNISFGLSCHMTSSNPFNVTPDEAGANTIMANANKLVADITNQGRFSQPFFIRYAFRLMDESLTMQSPPILMMPSNGMTPIAKPFIFDHDSSSWTAFCFAPACNIDMQLTNLSDIPLTQFSDIIKSVDIFVSAPIFSYNQSGNASTNLDDLDDGSRGIFAIDNIDNIYSGQSEEFRNALKKHNRWNIIDALKASIGSAIGLNNRFILPSFSQDDKHSSFTDTFTYYLIKSIPLNELYSYTSRQTIELPEGYLNTLLQRETLPDDYDSHDSITPVSTYGYNSRLVIGGLNKNLFNGYANLTFADTFLTDIIFSDTTGLVAGFNVRSNRCLTINKVFVHIKRDGRDIIVANSPNLFIPFLANDMASVNITFLYHPDTNATALDIFLTGRTSDNDNEDSIFKVSLSLRTHDFLNGSFYFDNLNNVSVSLVDSIDVSVSPDISIPLHNKLYLSEVGNPFFFPVDNIRTVGMDSILAIRSASRPLSTGQHGQTPLYCFCSDGLYALHVNDNGTLTYPDNISQEVVSNTNSITQLEQSVLFASARGIMIVSGSNVTCISDTINTQYPFDPLDKLPKLSTLNTPLQTPAPFLQFLDGCRMIYDYIHQHIIVYNHIFNYAYVYSLKSKQWGMMQSDFNSSLNSYPDTLAMTQNNRLVSLSDNSQPTTFDTQVIVSRPLKLDNPNILKSVHSIIQHGLFQLGDVKTVLYGSRDLVAWHLVASSTSHKLRHCHGSPYMYFRIVIITTLSVNNSLADISVDFSPRHLNQPH